jgi:alpha-amylase
MDWIAASPAEEQIINICLNMETFGAIHTAESGIFHFLEALPRMAAERGIEFWTPSDAIRKLKAVDELRVMHFISQTDEARDTSAWLGNKLQNEAFQKLYSVAERVRLCTDRRLKQDWWYLQGSDHFYYMSTKRLADGAAHSAFSPYDTPFDAFTNYMNAVADFIVRVEDQYPMEIENEELNALLTTIRNQEREIAELNKELASMRQNIEQYNVEHALRVEKPAAEKAPKAKPAKAKPAKAAKKSSPKAEK